MSLRQKPRVDYSQFFESALDGLTPNSKSALMKSNKQLKLSDLQIPKLNSKKRKRGEDDEYRPEESLLEKENRENASPVRTEATETPSVQVKKLKRSNVKLTSTTASISRETKSETTPKSESEAQTLPAQTDQQSQEMPLKVSSSSDISHEIENSEKPPKKKSKPKSVDENEKNALSKTKKSKKKTTSLPVSKPEIENFQESEQNTNTESANWKERYTALRENFRLLKKKYDKLREEQNGVVSETTSSLTTLSSELRAQAKELTDVRAQLSTLQTKYDKIKTELEEKQTLIKKLERENETLKERKSSKQYEEKINSLETELQAVRTENTQLQQLNKELKDHEAKLEKELKSLKKLSSKNHQRQNEGTDDSAALLQFLNAILEVKSTCPNTYECSYINTDRTKALKFELTFGLQDDMVQFKPLPTRSVGSVPTAKQHELPDFLRRTIFLPRNEIPILLSKIFIRLNSNKSQMQ